MKTEALKKEEISARALMIACELFEKLGIEIEPGQGPATAREIRRFLRNKARKELLKKRGAKRETLTP